jgi:hypothetical protein
MAVERKLPKPQPAEEVYRWHGVLDVSNDAREVLEQAAADEGMSYDECLGYLQRQRYRYSQVEWPMMIGEEPREKMAYYSPGISLTTGVRLPTGRAVNLTTHCGVATEISLRD